MKVIDMVSWYVVHDCGETAYQYYDGPLSYEEAVGCINYEFSTKGRTDLKLASTLTTNLVIHS